MIGIQNWLFISQNWYRTDTNTYQ